MIITSTGLQTVRLPGPPAVPGPASLPRQAALLPLLPPVAGLRLRRAPPDKWSEPGGTGPAIGWRAEAADTVQSHRSRAAQPADRPGRDLPHRATQGCALHTTHCALICSLHTNLYTAPNTQTCLKENYTLFARPRTNQRTEIYLFMAQFCQRSML